MSVEEKVIEENWEKFIGYVDTYITGDRKQLLKDMYERYSERLCTAPASMKEYYHNAFPGGLLLHVNNVIEASVKLYELWKSFGANVDNFTLEELVFVAMNHDLGKIGDEVNEYYQPCVGDSDWKRKRGEIYETVPQLTYMNVSDRSLFLLQRHGIVLSQNEYIGLYLADGLYEEKNEPYYKTWNPNNNLRFNLPYIVHQADLMSMLTERGKWIAENDETFGAQKIVPTTSPKRAKSNPEVRNEATKKVFSESKTNFNDIFERVRTKPKK